MEKLVILGSGPAGLTAGIYAARANLHPLILSGEQPGGLLTQTSEVENFPGFPDGINGFDLMFAMQNQAERFGGRIEMEKVESVELQDNGPHKLHLSSGSDIETQTLIVATGASPRWLGLESETRLRNHGVSACATCDGAFYENMDVVVAGGGDSAMEEAIFLTKFASSVTVVHRRGELRASPIMAERALKNDKIRFVWNAQIIEVLGDAEVRGVKVRDINTLIEQEIPCKGLFVALGHVPSTQLFRGILAMDSAGFLELQNNSSQTNLRGVFAAGDCADPTYRQAITAAGMGARAGIDAARYLS